MRLERAQDTFSGYMSHDGVDWKNLGSVGIRMGEVIYVGLPACSQLKDVTYDRVTIPSWRMTGM